VTIHDRMVPARPRVAMFGDSLTHFGPWPQLLPSYDVINFGVSGNTSAQAADRADPVLQCAPAHVVLAVGTNDIGLDAATVGETASTIEAIVDQLSAHSRVIVATIPPRQAEFAARIGELNARISGIAAAHGSDVLDLWSLLDDGSGVLPAHYTTDGLHLNDAGYSMWAHELNALLDRH
jgi:lysophospholipase L1-like esterase